MRGPLVTKEESEKNKNKIYFDTAYLLSPQFYEVVSTEIF